MRKTFFLVCATATLFSSQLILFNDSAFPLTATIVSATGQALATTDLKPQQQKKWTDTKDGNANISETPYTVVFMCKDGGEFGVSSNQPAGGLASANASSGRKYCSVKAKKRGESTVPSQRGNFEEVYDD